MSLPRRPSETDADVIAACAERSVVHYRNATGDWDTPTRELLEPLKDALRSPFRNGYERARDWEQWYGFSPDLDMVEFLDNLSAREEHIEAVKRWVQDNGITATFQIGSIVCFRLRGDTVTGEITEIFPETAVVAVLCESLGHVRTGLGTHGFFIAFEDLSEATIAAVKVEGKS
jgi:hypothetical protein